MEKQAFLSMLDRFLEGTASAEEEQMVINYLDSFQGDATMLPDIEGARNSVLLRLQKEMHPDNAKVRWLRPWLRVAVAAVFIAGVSVLLYFSQRHETRNVVTAMQDVQPGFTRAYLTLADGARVALDSAQEQRFDQEGVSVTQRAGQLNYTGNSGTGVPLAFNTLNTPRGGQFRVVLPDGSKVWLNAASSIRFPVAFTGKERTVQLAGEAYFEIARDANSVFNVETANGTRVKVLGTSFNINAYDDEPQVRATLLTGAISVSTQKDLRTMRPGETAAVSSSKEIIIKHDPAAANTIAWKNGYFDFNGMKLREAMRQLERWYDIEVEYEGDVADIEFFGQLTRSNTLNETVRALSATGLKVKIEKGRMIVLK